MTSRLSQRFLEFCRQFPGAELIDELDDPRLRGASTRADVLFEGRKVVCEIKSLETDTAQKLSAILRPYEESEHWPQFYGECQVGRILEHLPNGADLGREIAKAVGSAVRDQVRSANRQIRETKRALSLPDAAGFVVILNESIDVLSPSLLANQVMGALNKKAGGGTGPRFESLQMAVVHTEAHLVDLGALMGRPTLLCMNSQLGVPKWFEDFVDELQGRWAAFNNSSNLVATGDLLSRPTLSADEYQRITGGRRTRQESWQLSYRRAPYLRGRSDLELFAFGRALYNDLTPRLLKGAPTTSTADMRPKWERWTHFLEEIAHRGIDLRVWGPEISKDGRDQDGKPIPTDELLRRAASSRNSPPELTVTPGRFYANRRMATLYFCEAVKGGSVQMIVLRSNPPGLQCLMTQSLAWAFQFEELRENEIAGAEALLETYRATQTRKTRNG